MANNCVGTDELPFILQGKYFKVTQVDKQTGKVMAMCVDCDKQKPSRSKLINGAIRPTSNFITHLKASRV